MNEWKKNGHTLSCQRSSSSGSSQGKCIWHSKKPNKNSEDLMRAKKSGSERLDGAYLHGTNLIDISFKDCSLRRARFDHSQISSTDFCFSDLGKASFRNSRIEDTTFFAAEMNNSDFKGGELVNISLRETFLNEANFIDSRWVGVEADRAEFVDSKCHEANFRYVSFNNALFRMTNFLGAEFFECEFERSQFTVLNRFDKSTIDQCEFRECDIGQHNFYSSKITNCDFEDVDFSGTNMKKCDLRGTSMSDITFSNTEFQGADLRDADFPDRLEDVNLDDTDLRNTAIRRRTFDSISMEGANLSNSDLYKTDFLDCDLRSAKFEDAKITHADLSGSNCSQADFSNATLLASDLTNTDFGRAELSGVIFELATLDATRFWRADLSKASLYDLDSETSIAFGNADLTDADLRGSQFDECDFEGATLRDVDARKSSLQGANFQNATLGNASLQDANLSDAKLFGAGLEGAQINTETTLLGDTLPYEDKEFVYNTEKTIFGQIEDKIQRIGTTSSTQYNRSGEVYEKLQELSKDNNIPDQARVFYLRKKDIRRQQASYPHRLKQELSWLVTEYADNPYRIIGSSLLTIIIFSIFYPIAGMSNSVNNDRIIFNFGWSLEASIESLYFSTVNFTSLGAGKWYPTGIGGEVLAGIQSLLGAVMLALLVFVLGRRATW